jgi:hypothetical protein
LAKSVDFDWDRAVAAWIEMVRAACGDKLSRKKRRSADLSAPVPGIIMPATAGDRILD